MIRKLSHSRLEIRQGTEFWFIRTHCSLRPVVHEQESLNNPKLGGLSVFHFPAEISLGQAKTHYEKNHRQSAGKGCLSTVSVGCHVCIHVVCKNFS